MCNSPVILVYRDCCTDINLIYDADPVQSVRNEKAQGALVMHNHPAWTKKGYEITPTEEVLYQEGLIDGIEVMNTDEFYPGIIIGCCPQGYEHVLFKRESPCCKPEILIAKDTIL